jgi:DNA-binding MarR family transcriptional regulator
MPPRAQSQLNDEALEQIWNRLSGLFVEKRESIFEILDRFQITPPHGFALTLLAREPIRMREMADAMKCDASYITAIVDHLEDAGLVRRQPHPADRRVKEVALTAKGKRAMAHFDHARSAPPDTLQKLSAADRADLLRILKKLMPEAPTDLNPFASNYRRQRGDQPAP